MDLDHAARCLEKLGHPTRLRIIRLLVRAGPDGLSVGAVQEHRHLPRIPLNIRRDTGPPNPFSPPCPGSASAVGRPP